MTREDPQLKLRLPEALRDALWKQSVANKRSMNGELVARLEASLSDQPELAKPSADAPTLVGMFFFQDDGEAYRTGEIISELKDGIYFVRPDDMTNRTPQDVLELLGIGEMLGTTDEGMPLFTFYPTRAAIEAHIEWIKKPSNPRVINIVKPNK